jgi:hypothetical protein
MIGVGTQPVALVVNVAAGMPDLEASTIRCRPNLVLGLALGQVVAAVSVAVAMPVRAAPPPLLSVGLGKALVVTSPNTPHVIQDTSTPVVRTAHIGTATRRLKKPLCEGGWVFLDAASAALASAALAWPAMS